MCFLLIRDLFSLYAASLLSPRCASRGESRIFGSSILPAGPIAAISDIGYPQVGAALRLDASASFDPNGGQLSYHWDFGDGQQASGVTVTHTYTHVGQYTLTLAVTSPSGTRTVQKLINISQQPQTYPNQYKQRATDTNSPNPAVHLPRPNDALHDRIMHTPFN